MDWLGPASAGGRREPPETTATLSWQGEVRFVHAVFAHLQEHSVFDSFRGKSTGGEPTKTEVLSGKGTKETSSGDGFFDLAEETTEP